MVRQNLRDVKVGQDCEADVVKAVVDEQLLIRYSDRHEVNRPLTNGMTAVPVAGLPLFAKAPFELINATPLDVSGLTERPATTMKAARIPPALVSQRGRRPHLSTKRAAVVATIQLKMARPPLIPAMRRQWRPGDLTDSTYPAEANQSHRRE